MSAAPAIVTHAPPLLWAAARALICTIFALFGDPSAIAAQHTHSARERSLLLKWLRAGEAFMRHLLLIEASHVARANSRPPTRMRRLRKRRLVTFEADKPEDWRVSFRCFLDRRRLAGGDGRKRSNVRRRDAGGPRFHSAWPLAERAEAMLRAFNHPEAYAKRLARRLYAAPKRAGPVLRHPPDLAHLTDDFDALREAGEAARRRFDSG